MGKVYYMNNINEILLVALIVGGIGALIGLVLAIASQLFHVEVDPRFEKIVSNLPGFNCGACGYAGCSGMAEALLKGEADVKNCTPGNEITYAKIKAILNGEDPENVKVDEKKASTNAKPACMKNTKMPPSTTQTLSIERRIS